MSESPVINKDLTRTFIPFQSFTGRIDVEFQDRVVNVEFFCGECCKKVLGATLTRIGSDFIELTSITPFTVLTFIPGISTPFTENVRAIIIPLRQVCSVERP